MSQFQPTRILCPVDFSERSALALRVAARTAAIFNAEVQVLHAHHLEMPVYFTSAQIRTLKAQLRRSARMARAYLRDFAAKHLPDSVPYTLDLVEGHPVSAILRALSRDRPGLVVMATHGRSGLTGIRLGSVMESVLRQTDVPLLTLGPEVERSAALGPLRRILAPVVLPGPPQRAFQYAADLAEAAGAELIALHVTERPDQNPENVRKKLCAWVHDNIRNRCSVREVVRHGDPAEQIVAEASASQVDLVVMEARPRKHLAWVLFGSTSEAVIRNSPRPLLLVRSDLAVPG